MAPLLTRAAEFTCSGMGKNDAAETHQPLQAVVMADSFTQPFRPITIQRPKVRYLSPAASAIGFGCSASAADEHAARVPGERPTSESYATAVQASSGRRR